jgi:hypothetical protein
MYGGVDVQLQTFLTSVLDGGDWSDSRPGRHIPKYRVLSIQSIRGWVGPAAGLGVVTERKYPFLAPDENLIPSRPACSLVTTQTRLKQMDNPCWARNEITIGCLCLQIELIHPKY